MLHIDGQSRVLRVNSVIRLYNGRKPGTEIHHGTVFRSHELAFKLSGASLNTIGGVPFDFSEGSILSLPKGETTGYTCRTVEMGEAIDIFFQAEAPLCNAPMLLPPPHRGRVRALFEQCYEAWRAGEEGRQLLCIGLLYEILGELCLEQSSTALTGAGQQIVSRVAAYLNEHSFDPQLSLSSLPERMGVSYSYIKKLFLRQYGMPPSRYVTLRRIERAKELLADPERPISEMSALLGYSSVYYFSRVFRQETGLSPSEYRALM